MRAATAMAENLLRRARTSLIDFILATFLAYRPGWFHRELAAKMDIFLADVVAHRSPRLIIMAPPQHGKSEIVSRRFPAFALGRYPDLKLIATSYNAELAETFSADVQRIIDSGEYHSIFPETRIVGRYANSGAALRQAGFFQIVDRRGSYRACGVGGGITGRGADIAIIDDPLSGRADANSAAVRETVWNWLVADVLTRVSEGGGVIVVATRWHQDDPTGRLLKAPQQGGTPWMVARFAAIAEEDEPHRRAGEALCPELFTIDTLREHRHLLGSAGFAALFQQRPVPAEGGIIKRDWIKYYKALPEDMDEIIQSWDLAVKGTKNSDYVSGQIWGRKSADYFLIDRIHARLDFPATIKAIEELSRKYPQAIAKLIEDKANGPAVIDQLRGRLEGIIPVPVEGSKEARVHAIAPIIEGGNVYLPDPRIAPWVEEFVDEVTSFPQAPHDDDVDAAAQALLRLHSRLGCPMIIDHRPIPGLHDPSVLSSASTTKSLSELQRRAYGKVTDGDSLTEEEENAVVFGDSLNED